MKPARWKLVGAFTAIYVIWGSTYLAMRVMVESLPPFLAAGLRHGLAGLAILAFVLLRGGRLPMRWQDWRGPVFLGLLFLVAGNGVVTWCLHYVPSGVGALLVGTVPLLIALAESLGPQRRRLRPAVWASLSAGLLGVGLLLAPKMGVRTDPQYLLGVLGILFASGCWAWGSLLVRSTRQPADKVLAGGMQMCVAGACLLLIGLLLGEGPQLRWDLLSARSGAAFLYLVVFGSWVAYLSFQWLLEHVEPAKVATYAYVNPAVAVLLGWWMGGETLDARVLFATLVIVGSVAVTVSLKEA